MLSTKQGHVLPIVQARRYRNATGTLRRRLTWKSPACPGRCLVSSLSCPTFDRTAPRLSEACLAATRPAEHSRCAATVPPSVPRACP